MPTRNAGPGRLTIAVLLDYANFISGGYEAHLREALDARCRQDGHTLLFLYGAPLDAPPPLGKADNAILHALHSDSFDGFIAASAALAAYSGPERVVELLENLRPAALCSLGVALPGIPSLVIDNHAGLQGVVEHLVRHHGCRRPVFLGGPPQNPESEERLQAYQDVLRRSGIPFDADLVICGNFRNDHARIAMDDLIHRGVPFDSVVAANDTMALGAIESLRRAGRRVPRDIPVTGFDDLLLARVGSLPLTTVAQPFERMAWQAVDTIVAQVDGRPVPERVVLPTRFVCRQSCGCRDGRHARATAVSVSPGPRAQTDARSRIAALRSGLAGALRARPEHIELVTTRLLAALAAVVSGQPSTLRETVADLLEDIGDDSNRHQILHDAITWLRDQLAELGDLELERAFYEGLSLVALSSTSKQLQQRFAVDDSYIRLLTVGEQASSAFDLASLHETLSKSLPTAGVRTVFLSCAPDATSSELVPLVCMVDGAAVASPEPSFPAGRLLPPLAFALERRRTFLVFPMAFGAQLLGVAAFDYDGGINTFDAFRSEIALVLRSIHLHQNLVEETTLRERSVQERLATTKRMEALSVLAGGVAHDLNNALGPLVALPDVILDELGRLDIPAQARSDLRADVESIRNASLRAAQTIKDLLTLGRQGRTVRRNLDLNSVVKSCLADSSLRFTSEGSARINMVVDLCPEPLRVRGSESQLARAVGNLVRNAVEATGGDGQITVKTAPALLTAPAGAYETIPAGQYAVFSIADDGCGIQDGDLGRVFEPFFTTKPTGERSGSGLGLAIVHGVLKEHEGFIDVRSDVETGTTFALYLPLERPRQASCEQLAEVPHGQAKILVVDDDPMQLRTCRRVLVRLGYEVEVMQSGLRAYELFSKAAPSGQSPFDLVIIDVVLNEMLDGLQIFELMQRLFPAQKAIVVSGHAPSERAEQAMKKGLPWLSKPYSIETLAHAVERALADGHSSEGTAG
jgi:DNA-binding LacI/PurR family transcriptional regulator/signal transduction histidine kinase/ActR/RegA family two-component response regulator